VIVSRNGPYLVSGGVPLAKQTINGTVWNQVERSNEATGGSDPAATGCASRGASGR